MKPILFLVSLIFTFSVSHAGELHGVKVPDKIKIDGKELVLNGLGTRKAFTFVKVYVAALYVPKKSKDPELLINGEGTKKLELHFLRYVQKNKLTDAWKDAFRKNKVDGYSYKDDLNLLNSAMTSMSEGEKIELTFYEDKAVVKSADKDAVTIPGRNFSKQMIKVFLGNPPNSELKTGLLGE